MNKIRQWFQSLKKNKKSVGFPKIASSISDFQPGTIIRQKNGAEGYIVTSNYGSYAIAVRTVHVSNPSEWEIVGKM